MHGSKWPIISTRIVDLRIDLDQPGRLRVRVRADIIGHARINMYVNISHAWFKMADYIHTHRRPRGEVPTAAAVGGGRVT